MTAILVALAVLLIAIALLAAASIRVLREYERAVIFRLGRLIETKGPGLVLLIPGIDRMVRVDLRTVVLDIPPQDLITRDNVTTKVNAVTYFRVVDAPRAVISVEHYRNATSQIAQTTLRSVLGKADLDMLLSERDQLNESLQQIIDEQTDPWGVKVTAVEIKDVEIPAPMQHAMARQAQAERERRAKVINAEGEYQASARLHDAAEIICRNPTTVQLRYLQTLSEIGANQNSTVVFPFSLDLIRPLLAAGGAAPESGETNADARAGHPDELPLATPPGTSPRALEAPARQAPGPHGPLMNDPNAMPPGTAGQHRALQEPEEPDVRFFRHKQEQQRFVPCPSCGELIHTDALECDMCGADLREPTPARPPDDRSETPH
jgi:regulator of protease activity HflC (stomatin/prohibitin superfamily)